jgi:hypothetical protein
MIESLCESCQNMREVRTARSRFLLCDLSVTYATASILRSQYCAARGISQRNRRTKIKSKRFAANMANHHLSLLVLPELVAVCRLLPSIPIPAWASAGQFYSITRTDDELSIVCFQDAVPDGVVCERDWRCLRVAGAMPFSVVGVLASLTTPLAEADISVFAISTFDTDYLLVKTEKLEEAVVALRQVGHSIRH